MSRRYLTTRRIQELSARLSERDWAVIAEVAALRFVSAAQLARLCFVGDARTARRALLRLTRLEVVERLPRPVGGVRAGSAGFVYCLGPSGQRLAAERGWLATRRTRRGALPGQLFVRHALAVAELHTRLVEAAEQGRFELLERAAEPACWRQATGASLKPDSFVRLGIDEFEDSYFIEVDRGTEGSRAIERQLGSYLTYHRSGEEQAKRGVFPKTLWLTTDQRRAEAIEALISQLAPADQALFEVTLFNNTPSVFTDGYLKSHP